MIQQQNIQSRERHKVTKHNRQPEQCAVTTAAHTQPRRRMHTLLKHSLLQNGRLQHSILKMMHAAQCHTTTGRPLDCRACHT